MSIKIKVSYTDEGEKRLILKLLRPLLEKGYRCKEQKGTPRSRIYIQHKGHLGGGQQSYDCDYGCGNYCVQGSY